MALAAAPSFAVSTLASVLPLFVGSFLVDNKVFSHKKFNLERFASSFPKEFWLRETMIHFAAKCALALAKDLAGRSVYCSCDKGKQWSSKLTHHIAL